MEFQRLESWGRAASTRRLMALAGLAGAIAALGLAPFNLWPLALVALAALFGLFQMSGTPRRAALVGWAAGCGYFALAMHWIVEPFLVDIARHGWMAPFALILMSGGLALFWGLAHGIARALGGRPLVWIMALSGAELLRSYVLTGFPWALIGHIWIEAPAAQYAAFVGPIGLTMAALAVSVTLWRLVGPARMRALPMLALYAALLFGAAQMVPPPEGAGEDRPVVRLIQPNAPQHQKWDPEMVPIFFRRQIGFTAAEAADGRRPDLIIWPETAVPVVLEYAEETLQVIADAAGDVPVVVGLQRYDGPRLFNTAVLIGAKGDVLSLYDKSHLVPFGEYLPFGETLARFGLHGLAASEGSGYSAGPGAQLMDTGAAGRALPLICYEAVFPQDVAAAPKRPDFLMQITNDAWFGKFSGPYQHLAQARLRAIEQGLPMVRVANTGVSTMIDGYGRMHETLPLGTAGWIDAPLPPALPMTPYARTGDTPFGLAILLVLGAFTLWRRRRPPGKID